MAARRLFVIPVTWSTVSNQFDATAGKCRWQPHCANRGTAIASSGAVQSSKTFLSGLDAPVYLGISYASRYRVVLTVRSLLFPPEVATATVQMFEPHLCDRICRNHVSASNGRFELSAALNGGECQ